MSSRWFTEAFGAAIADVRQQLVERGWFGEVVTPDHQPARETERPVGFDFGDWMSGNPSPISRNPDVENYLGHESAPSQDLGIDR
jgi:hypothetical protein